MGGCENIQTITFVMLFAIEISYILLVFDEHNGFDEYCVGTF